MKPYICSQCGAPLHGEICEYCGTSFEGPSMGELITLYSDDLAIQIQNARNLKELDAIYDFNMSAILTPNELRQNLLLCDVNVEAIRQYGETDEVMMSMPIELIKPKFSIWQKIKSLFKGKDDKDD